MERYLTRIFGAKSTDTVCGALQSGLNDLRKNGYLDRLSDFHENMTANNANEVQEWFDEMNDDPQNREEGPLKEVYGLFQAALSQLRKLGFHRETD